MSNMKNSARSEKSRGVVLFATNTQSIDYESIARRAERLIKRYLDLPTTILTASTDSKNQRYNIDTGEFESWNNFDRYLAYELSPYEQTILLDCDYFVLDDNLLKILDSLQDYKIVRHNHYLDGESSPALGKHSIPSLWATIVAFERTEKAKLLFDFVARIQRNYSYYRQLYNIEAQNFRNDYAFTIADLIINGYTQDSSNYIPWPMLSIQHTLDSVEIQNNKLYVKSNNCAYVVPKQSIHFMSKAWLTSDECEQFVKDAERA